MIGILLTIPVILSRTTVQPVDALTGRLLASGPAFLLPEGTSLAPGESRAVNVTFSPTSNGAQTDQWVLNADGSQGTLIVVFQGTGTGSTDAGSGNGGGSDAGGGGEAPVASHGCTAAAGSALWPLLLLVGWLLRPRSARR